MAILEIAGCCGLTLVPEDQRDPRRTTTYGLGELIRHTMGRGCRAFLIGIGGSATNNAGLGMLTALGFRFFTQSGERSGISGDALQPVRQSLQSNAALIPLRFGRNRGRRGGGQRSGIDAYFAIPQGPLTLQEAMEPGRAYKNLSSRVEQVFRVIALRK